MRNGYEIRHYSLPAGRKNEILDLSVYALAAFMVRDWNLPQIEAENLATIPRKDGTPQPTHDPYKIKTFKNGFV